MTNQSIPIALNTALPAPRQIFAAFFNMLATQGLSETTWPRLATAQHWPLAALRRAYPTLGHMLTSFSDFINDEMRDAVRPDADAVPRDIVFECLMARLDALQIYRNGFSRLLKELPTRPDLALVILRQVPVMLNVVADYLPPTENLWQRPLHIAALTGLYARLLKIWLQDTSPDLSKTMAFLDDQLDKYARYLVPAMPVAA